MKRLISLLTLSGLYIFTFAGTVQIMNIDLPSRINEGKHWIEGDIKNTGNGSIASMVIHWTIDAGVARTDTLTGLNIATGQTYHWVSSRGWGAENAGSFTFKAWISEVNGVTGEVDDLQKNITVFKAAKIPLVDIITSANCGPCAATVPGLQERVNNTKSYGLSIEWHGGPGGYAGDDMYQDNMAMYSRMGYYNGSAYPTATINGNISTYDYPTQIDETVIYNESLTPSDFEIKNVSLTVDSGMANFYADVTAVNPPSSYIPAYRFHVVLIEKHVKFATPPGTNGETEFFNVAKQMYPNTTGTKLSDILAAGKISGSFDLSSLHVYDKQELAVIFFIQNNSLTQTNGMKEIYQAAFADLRGEPDVTIPEDPHQSTAIGSVIKSAVNIYPNPASEDIFVTVNAHTGSSWEYSLTNISGKEIMREQFTGEAKEFKIPANQLPEGVYFVKVKAGNVTEMKRVIISR